MAQVAGAGPQAGEPAKLLSGKRVLVTGASRGIGQAIAEAFAEQGASLVLAARSQDRLQEVGLGGEGPGRWTVHAHFTP